MAFTANPSFSAEVVKLCHPIEPQSPKRTLPEVVLRSIWPESVYQYVKSAGFHPDEKPASAYWRPWHYV